jgi:hypothetical protein
VSVHFPYPAGEQAADIVLGKFDAVELFPDFGLRFLHWYRALNCGYRLPAVGGTGKMGAGTPVGGNRTYARLGGEPVNPANWARAVCNGNTFMTTGPLLLFEADGRAPGREIRWGQGGGSIMERPCGGLMREPRGGARDHAEGACPGDRTGLAC